MNSKGLDQVRLTNNDAWDVAPTLWPDGSKIAFISNRDGPQCIYVMDADGSNQTRLFPTPDSGSRDGVYLPIFSPDGKIIFRGTRNGTSGTYIMDADGSNMTLFQPVSDLGGTVWDFSADGSKMLFWTSSKGWYVANADGSGATLTSIQAGGSNVSLSPDGSSVVYQSTRRYETYIYTSNADGTGEVRLTGDIGNYDADPVFSPDGSKIAFVSTRNAQFGGQEIYTMNADGSGVARLTYNPRWDQEPDWVDGIVKPKASFSAEPTKTDRQVRLDASGSKPRPGGTLTSYEWDFGDGTTLTTSEPVITHTFPERERDYLVKLIVVGAEGTKSDPYTSNVHSPKATPTADFSFTVNSGGKVEFDAGNSTPHSPGLPIKEYEWTFDDGSAVSKVAAKTTEHSYDYFDLMKPVKKYMVSLVVTDSEGNRSDPVKREVDVCSPDLPPANGFEYGGLVRCVEVALPAQSPREILSTMRKIYYGEQWSNARDKYWDDIIPCGVSVSVPDPRPQLSPKLYRALIEASTNNTVANGDIAHVFTGLEALKCPSDTTVFPIVRDIGGNVPPPTWTVKMPNYFIATWGGDVGSAAGQKAVDDRLGDSNDWSNYIGPNGIRAGYYDLNGNVDGLVLGYSINGSSCSGAPTPTPLLVPLSQSLRDYYPDPDKPLEVSAAYKNRIQCFKDILAAHKLTDERLDKLIYEFALPYYYRVAPRIIIGLNDPTKTVRDYSSTAAGLFTDWLNSQR
jgi:Tol biopolymer transport system component